MKTCPVCNKEFTPANSRSIYCDKVCKKKNDDRKYYQSHKESLAEYTRQWRKDNREQYLLIQRKHNKANYNRNKEEKLRKKKAYRNETIAGRTTMQNLRVKYRNQSNLVIDPADVLKKFGEVSTWLCNNCNAMEDMTFDHIKAFSLGGEHTIDNMQILCGSCNSSKGNYERWNRATPEVYGIRNIDKISEEGKGEAIKVES